MSRRIFKAKRAFLLALVRNDVCAKCKGAPAVSFSWMCRACLRKHMASGGSYA